MLTIRCCVQPHKHEGGFKLPKRLSRARRVAEVKRMETNREIHTALKTENDETEFIEAFFKNQDGQKYWWGYDVADEEAAENEE